MQKIYNSEWSSLFKKGINALLNPFNVKIDSLTEERMEMSRLQRLKGKGHFSQRVFPVPESFRKMNWKKTASLVGEYEKEISKFLHSEKNKVGFSFKNNWYTSPDAEILYSIARDAEPNRIIEIGCGNSTKLFRQAILDENLETTLVSIDPNPRTKIASLSDIIHRNKVENIEELGIFKELGDSDILFIDSSHVIRTGNDVVFLFLTVLPVLSEGVLVHVHDIFLPYDYPSEWKIKESREWNEQYLVQSILQYGNMFDVLWAGHYIQRSLAGSEEFNRYFPHAKKSARSLWLRKTTGRMNHQTNVD